ncbi:pyrimidine 5'-nucleotidase [Telmatospirillum siberiense]|uniref:Pyrimidine 5'-nucleotidase n=1 Tax=Telmatospirillum siberiense TaxID=382514 RepID=A0A2N3Q0M3_9PROT|nr:pyrimidine 5'-nucleotidase [Telmatospirillum siberiense]PKU26207.1 pyrimidine 5'-nucleotidase [Telmatospirillum siberiense]
MQSSTETPPPIDPPPALSHVDSWIFDLDNTLYPASCNLFAQIDVRMRQFISEALHLGLDEAFTLQKRYYHEYGTTLRGLMLSHGIEPGVFLAYVHDIDYSPLPTASLLDSALERLAGRKIVFTNGSERHAESVLAKLGLTRHFDAIFDIQAADYIPKPNAESYRRMALHCGIDPKRSAMFEDIARNLAPAAAVGMTTVWVHEEGHTRWSGAPGDDLSHIHHVTDDLAGWLSGVAKARTTGTASLP